MSASDPFVLRLGDDFAGPRPAMVKVFPLGRRRDGTARLGVRTGGSSGTDHAVAHIDLAPDDLRAVAAALTARADEIEDAALTRAAEPAPEPEHDQQAAPTATTGGDA